MPLPGSKKKKVLKTATHYVQLMQERINRLRMITPRTVKEEVMIANAIGYLSNVALTSIRDSDMEKRIEALEKRLGIYE